MESVFSLQNKTVLVTGASSGIGKCCAIRCSEAGACVVVTGRNAERLGNTFADLSGSEHIQMCCDLTQEEAVESFVNNIPPLDGLVLCAGMTQTVPVKRNSKLKTEEIFNTNLFSNIALLRQLMSKGKLNKGASVIFISSVSSLKPYKGNSLYAATKGAINSFSKVMALECSSKGIRVNVIMPGIIRTKPKSNFSEEEMAKTESMIPLGFGHTDDIAYGCIYLLSEASRWITGTELVIDGGQLIG